MELIEVLQKISQDAAGGMGLTDLTIGTVTRESPLEITTQVSMQVLKSPVLYLTESVVEKKLPILTHKHRITILGHSHSIPEGSTGPGLEGSYLSEDSLTSEGFDGELQDRDILCWENGKPLPAEDGFLILNRKLETGDKVLLLRVQRGQKFVVLSRVYGGEA